MVLEEIDTDVDAPETVSFRVNGKSIKTPIGDAMNALAALLNKDIDREEFRKRMGLDGTTDLALEYAITKMIDAVPKIEKALKKKRVAMDAIYGPYVPSSESPPSKQDESALKSDTES